MRRNFAALTLALVVSVGCTAGTRAGAGGARSSSSVLTQQEIATVPVDNAYDAIQRLRPTFLRARTTSSGPGFLPVVYVDGMRKGAPEHLRTIPARELLEVRYLTVQDATTRYGFNVEAGVIDVKLVGR